jgi:predicted RND superfamily exporter protein
MLAFALSPIPLVRQFALFMALGVASSWAVSVLVGIPVLAIAAERFPRLAPPRQPAPWETIQRVGRLGLVPAVALAAIGLLGWAAMPFVKLETDPAQLMPAGSKAVAEAQHVQHAVGLVGEVDLVLKADRGHDVTSAEAVAWLKQATDRATSTDLRPLMGLSGFLTAFNNGSPPDSSTTQLILQRLPTYFTGAVVSGDHHLARSIFGVSRLTSVDDDRALVARLNAAGNPPAGYHAYPAGLAVLAAQALSQLETDQLRLNALALAIVLVILLGAYRRPLPAVLAVLPTAVAAGWATALLAALRVSSGPITILLAGVVVAFATEFSVLWLSRYRSERAAGMPAAEASATASARIGPAIAASALALAAGFVVLVLSPVPMVRDFGLVCGLDLALATIAVLALLPPMARAWLK